MNLRVSRMATGKRSFATSSTSSEEDESSLPLLSSSTDTSYHSSQQQPTQRGEQDREEEECQSQSLRTEYPSRDPTATPAERTTPLQEYLLVALVAGLSVLYAITVLYAVPQIVPMEPSTFWTHAGIVAVLTVMFWTSYALASGSDPGSVPVGWRNEIDVADGALSYCGMCSTWKPLRTHHCSRCGQCTLKFDHHCFYIANCVGYRNQKYFYLLLCYGFTLLSYMTGWAIAAWALFIEQAVAGDSIIEIAPLVVLAIGSVGMAMQTPSLGYMWGLHTFLISKNATNLEWVCCKGQRYACHFTHFSVLENFKEVLGRNLWLWAIPIRTYNGIDHYGLDFRSTLPHGAPQT